MQRDSSFTLRRPAVRRRAFTLIEMLIVTAIITMIILIAIPSFRAMTGGRSVDAAANNLSALIGRARADAIGLQRTTGILFYMDQASDRVAAVMVREVPPPGNNNAAPNVIYLDLTPGAEFILLPNGVGLNTFDNAAAAANGVRSDDGLIGFNPVFIGTAFTNPVRHSSLTSLISRCGGAILFDGAGRLVVRPYRLLLDDGVESTDLVKLLSNDRNFAHSTTNTMGKACAGPAMETSSSVGFILFDVVQFRDATTVTTMGTSPQTFSFTTTERDGSNGNLSTTMPDNEKSEELWIDQNGTPFLVARHSGGLMRSR